MQPIDAENYQYEVMLLFDIPVIFAGRKIDPETIPEGIHVYEVQYNAEGEPICMGEKITSHYFGGTALSVEPIELNEHGCRSMCGNDLVWHPDYGFCDLSEYLELFGQDGQTPVITT